VARYNEYKDIVVAKVTTAVPLNDENEKEIIALVHKMKKGNVQIEEVIDPELIGGFIVRVGDMQIDSSVIRELNVMRREMNENPYIAEL
jgi:F-type H+-transporting ATPase subunit delta